MYSPYILYVFCQQGAPSSAAKAKEAAAKGTKSISSFFAKKWKNFYKYFFKITFNCLLCFIVFENGNDTKQFKKLFTYTWRAMVLQ